MSVENPKEASLARYARPQLVVYGDFARLTAAGSGTLQEGAMMTTGMRFI